MYSISINILSELFTEYSFNRDLKRFEDGISEKLGFAIYYSSGSVVNLILAFTLGWKLTLVVLAFAPLLAISTGVMTKVSETQFISQFFLRIKNILSLIRFSQHSLVKKWSHIQAREQWLKRSYLPSELCLHSEERTKN